VQRCPEEYERKFFKNIYPEIFG